MNVSIIIPLYNEEARFQQFFPTLLTYLKTTLERNSYEIICVNDGSKDKTKKLSRFLKRNTLLFDLSIFKKTKEKVML